MRLLPFHDLPWHLAAATIVKFYGDPGNHFSDYFYVNTSVQPNIFHLVFTSSNLFSSVEIANKWFVTIYIVLLPVSTLLLINYFKGNPWYSLLSFLYLYNYNVRWGFVSFFIAIPFFLLLFYFILKSQSSNSIWNKVFVSILFIVVFSMHALVTIFALMVFTLMTVYRYRHSFPKMLLHFLIILPVLAVMAIWWKTSQSDSNTLDFLISYYSGEFFQTLLLRKELLFADNDALFATEVGPVKLGTLIGSLFSAVIIIPILIWLAMRFKTIFADLRNSVNINIWFFLFCASCISLFAPDRLPGQMYLYQRFSVFVFISLILLLSVLFAKKLYRLQVGLISAAVIIHFVLYTDYFIDFQKETASFTKEILPNNIDNGELSALLYEDKFRNYHLYQHFANYHIVWNHKIAATALIDFRFGTVRRKANREVLPEYNSWFGYHRVYTNEYNNMDYILVKGKLPENISKSLENFSKIKAIDTWSLYKNINHKYAIDNVSKRN